MRRQSGLRDETFGVILRCADFPRHVYPSLESIERQHLAPAEIVLVTDDTTPPAARPWIRQLARARGLLFVHVPRSSPGAVRNAGIAATTAAFIVALDSGELLDRRYFAQAFGRFVSEPSLDLVTSNVLMLGPGTQRRILEAGDCGLSGIVASPDAIHGAAIFRRRTWEAFGGFDESLPALDHYDFALKLAAAGRRCAVLDLPLLIRPVRRETLYRRAWERDRHVAAMDAIVRAHAEVFASDPASVLCAKERELQELGGHYRALVERRDCGVAELTSLESQAETARASVPSERASTIDVADFRRTTPVSRNWGFERGIPIDRYYIEGFLSRHAADIQGTVLEVQDPDYTHLFGAERVTRSDVVDLNPSNPRATVLSDLRAAANIPDETYNCIILTQTLHLIDDMPAVVAECARILAPGGVLLVTLPCASRVCVEYGIDGDFWRLTEAGARRLFSTAFPPEQLEVERSGNVLANAAFLYGLGRDELSAAELDANDPYFPLLITVRAVKSRRLAAIAGEDRPVGKRFSGRGKSAAAAAVLRYHRVAEPKDDLHGLSIAPEIFRAQLRELKKNYHPVRLDALVAMARDDEIAPGAVAVTFDDGYLDNLEWASPILQELEVPATFFVATGGLEQAEYYFWWDMLEHHVLSPRAAGRDVLDLEIDGASRSYRMRSREDRLTAYWDLYQTIIGRAVRERNEVMKALVDWAGLTARPDAGARRMRPSEIATLAARDGHTIGAHTSSHLMLPLQPAAVRRSEIEESQRALERLLERPIRSFAYPFGAFDDATVGAVREVGFEMAVTCEDRPLRAGDDCLRLPRLEVKAAHPFPDWLRHHIG